VQTTWKAGLLAVPALLLLAAFFVAPMLTVIRMSFDAYVSGGQQTSAFTLASYETALSDRLELGAVGRTAYLAVIVTVLTMLASYPVALFLARVNPRWRGILLALAVAPLLTADVVRIYGWLILLGSNGILNSMLTSAGLITQPVQLVYNETGTIIGLVEILMPYAILTLFASLIGLETHLEEAAASLGAGRWQTFRRVILPLSLPGIAVSVLLVVVLIISSYITPSILGGGRVFTVAVEIFRHATLTLNWPLASALAVLLLVAFAVLLVVYSRIAARIDASVRG
jgi:putative spermidine/putrescine transport system permease protein